MPRPKAARTRRDEPRTDTVFVGDILDDHGLAAATGALPKTGMLRVKVPVPLLVDRARATPVRIAVYGKVESIQRRAKYNAAPERCTWGTAAICEHLGLTRSPVERAMTWLRQEGWLESQQIGRGRTARRWVRAGIPFVAVPTWTLQLLPATLDPELWRLYALYLHLRHVDRAGSVEVPTADIAQLIKVDRDRVPKLNQALADAGLIVLVLRPPRPNLVLPLLRKTTDAQRNAAGAELAASVRRLSTTPPATGGATSPGSEGPTSPPSEGGTGSSDFGISEISLSKSRRQTRLGPWCRRCLHPSDRRVIDLESGRPTDQLCPACGVPSALSA